MHSLRANGNDANGNGVGGNGARLTQSDRSRTLKMTATWCNSYFDANNDIV